MAAWSFYSAGTLFFGRGAIDQLPTQLARIGSQHPLIVCDENMTKTGLLDRLLSTIAQFKYTVDSRVTPEPPEQTISQVAEDARAIRPDAVIGLGGGSNMDAAKLVALCLSHGGLPSNYVGDSQVPGPILPLICVPTTAGTGSEVSPAAVFTHAEKKIKVSCLSHFLRPTVALVDPSLTDDCPRQVTAESGVDALTHAIEAFIAVDHEEFVRRDPGQASVYQGKNPMADTLAIQAIKLIANYLSRAVHQARDTEARDGMALAATLAGLAFSNAGVGLVHAMEYPIGGARRISHGAGNGLLLPHVMRYFAAHRTREYEELTLAFGGKDAIEAVESLITDVGIPRRLRELGIQADNLKDYAQQAAEIKRLIRLCPAIPDIKDITMIYHQAY